MKKNYIKKLFPWLIFLLLPYFYSSIHAPTIYRLNRKNPRQTKFMKYYLKKISRPGQRNYISYHFVPLNKISPSLPQAVIYAEDCNFYRHHGIDWESIWRSFRENRRRGKIVHGGSTISMQLCKNIFLYPQKTFARKIIEILLTSRLEKNLTKERILELYLNVIEWGPGIYGAENAAQYYFGKSARELNRSESALLAAIIMSPRAYRPEKPNPFFQRRQNWILAHLQNINQPELQYLPDTWPIEELNTMPTISIAALNESAQIELAPLKVSENLELPATYYGIEGIFAKMVSADPSANH